MESLYRKYRPQTFETIVGQRNVVTTLQNALNEGRLSHAYLFSGPRGTGKTTTARVLAKAIMCEKGTSASPDGTCEQCRLIAEGRHPDVYELDAASRTGVDNVRQEIINSVAFAPTMGRSKVYIIDEVHMLSTPAFNALLKTLEEPPAHVTFILCTTDPQKVPETVQSRCQRLEFHRIQTQDIARNLEYVSREEGFTADPEALEQIARHSRGGMRDALSLLEQLSVFGQGAIRLDDVRSVLGEASGESLSQMAGLLARRDVAGSFALVAQLAEDGADIQQFARDLTAYVRNMYVVSLTGALEGVVDVDEDPVLLKELADETGGPDRLARMLGVLGDLQVQMRTTPDPRLTLEVGLTRMARPETDLTLEALAERIADLEARLAAGVSSAPVAAPAAVAPASAVTPAAVAPASAATPAATTATPAAQQPAQVETPAPAMSARPQATPASASVPQAVPATPVSAPAEEARPATPAGSSSAPAQTSPASIQDPASAQRMWLAFKDEVQTANASIGGLINSTEGYLSSPDTLTIVTPANGFAFRLLQRSESREFINGLVHKIYGASVSVSLVMEGDPGVPTSRAAMPSPAPQATPAVRATPALQPAATPAPTPAPQPAPSVQPAQTTVPMTDESAAHSAPEPLSASEFFAAPEPEAVPAAPAPTEPDPTSADLPWSDPEPATTPVTPAPAVEPAPAATESAAAPAPAPETAADPAATPEPAAQNAPKPASKPKSKSSGKSAEQTMAELSELLSEGFGGFVKVSSANDK